ncbi:MAG: SDR family oxidoreductase [Gammaproteobacteria bacterium]|nr:SDR family oxidoreductase [Gammaproteobacteria bacterium]
MNKEQPVALVTGGSAGIGAQICEDLLERGYYVLNLSLSASKNQHENLRDVEVDLADVAATSAVLDELANAYEITNVVHNAGVIRAALIEDVALEDVQYLVDLHINASITIVQTTLDAMKRAGFGRIVIISSRAMLGLETRTGYSATKAAQIGLVRTWALELGRYGITANAIAPGPIVTDMFTAVVPEGSEKARQIAESLPVKRLGEPGDISRLVAFLLEPDTGFITGQCVFVCGGASLGSLAL